MPPHTNGSPLPHPMRQATRVLAEATADIANSTGPEKLIAIKQASAFAYEGVLNDHLDERPATNLVREAVIRSRAMEECGPDAVQDAIDAGENDAACEHLAGKQQATREAAEAAGGKRQSQADILIAIGACADLYRTPDDVAYADIAVGKHRETWAVRSREFRQYLQHEYYNATEGSAPNSEAMTQALATLDAKARFSGVQRPVHLRVAEMDGKLYIDLCNDERGVIEVAKHRWRYTLQAPVRFRRTRGMRELPKPTRGGNINDLARFIRANGDDFKLIVAWLIAAMRPWGPYPALVLTGEQGGGKSTMAAAARGLVDPHAAAHRAPPRNTHDLYVAATNNHVLALDNLSGIAPDLSDAMCRLATGGGFAARTLYTDTEETLFTGQRPIILTGISDIASRSDLADRALFVRLGPLDDGERRTESEFWAEFEKARPAIFGALLTAMVAGLRNLPSTRLDKLPRMADFALWVAACEDALPWGAGEHLDAYCKNRKGAVETVLGADAIADALQRFMDGRGEYTTTASDLLAQLNLITPDHVKRDRASWPLTASSLSGRLTRLAPALRGVGITMERGRAGDRAGSKLLRIVRSPVEPPK